MMEERERAVEVFLHRIAAGVHAMLAGERMTAAELIAALQDAECDQADLIPAILAATPEAGKATCSTLSLIAWILKFDWNFHITKIQQPEVVPDAGND